jgi:hypothetical protein
MLVKQGNKIFVKAWDFQISRLGAFIVLFFIALQSVANTHVYWVDLYGHKVSINFQKPVRQVAQPLQQSAIQHYLAQVSANSLADLLTQMDAVSQKFGMDDMAYLLFAQKVSQKIYADFFEQNLFKYQLLKHKGYRVILGYSEDYLTVYANLDFKVHNVAFVEHAGFTYTDLSFAQHLETCEEQLFELPQNGRAVTMNESRPPFFEALSRPYSVHFEYEGMSYHFQGLLNQSLVQYYRELPAIEFGQVYLNYQMSGLSKGSLVNALKQATKHMFPSKQIDFLLQFAQTAFPYKKDFDAIGIEKFAFPEEVLANQYADCEDKSVLFAYLAKEVLDLPSVALIYYVDNHLNVGVAFNHKSAYNFIYNNQKYLVCEPSGLGFKPGDNVYDVQKASIVSW